MGITPPPQAGRGCPSTHPLTCRQIPMDAPAVGSSQVKELSGPDTGFLLQSSLTHSFGFSGFWPQPTCTVYVPPCGNSYLYLAIQGLLASCTCHEAKLESASPGRLNPHSSHVGMAITGNRAANGYLWFNPLRIRPATPQGNHKYRGDQQPLCAKAHDSLPPRWMRENFCPLIF